MAGPAITRAHRALIGVVAAGAFIIAGIGFAGSYSAVRTLALHKGFGVFSYVFPIGVDVGIAVLLALDLVLTWLRIPFPLLRQTAWLLTGGTIVFNAASSWGDPLAMAMHAIIPVLFVVVVEAARHAIGRIADITADRHMESVRLMRWILSPVPTFRLWRRMKLWELRSYDEVVRLEQNRLVYRTHLRAQYGRGWRRHAPIETLLPLKLAKYGVPLDMDAIRRVPAPALAPAAPAPAAPAPTPAAVPGPTVPAPAQYPAPAQQQHPGQHPAPAAAPVAAAAASGPDPVAVNVLTKLALSRHRRPLHDPDTSAGEPSPEPQHQSGATATAPRGVAWLPKQHPSDANAYNDALGDDGPEAWFAPKVLPDSEPEFVPAYAPSFAPKSGPVADARPVADPIDAYLDGLVGYREAYGHDPDPEKLSEYLFTARGLTGKSGNQPIAAETLRRHWPEMQQRFAVRYE